jgi:hypothetical protein
VIFPQSSIFNDLSTADRNYVQDLLIHGYGDASIHFGMLKLKLAAGTLPSFTLTSWSLFVTVTVYTPQRLLVLIDSPNLSQVSTVKMGSVPLSTNVIPVLKTSPTLTPSRPWSDRIMSQSLRKCPNLDLSNSFLLKAEATLGYSSEPIELLRFT